MLGLQVRDETSSGGGEGYERGWGETEYSSLFREGRKKNGAFLIVKLLGLHLVDATAHAVSPRTIAHRYVDLPEIPLFLSLFRTFFFYLGLPFVLSLRLIVPLAICLSV